MSDQMAVQADSAAGDRQRHPLARGLELLTAMVDSAEDVHGVRELGMRLGVSASTAHRLLGDLEKLGMVGRTTSGGYRLGLEFLRIAWTTAARFPLREAANDILHELTEQTGESSFFAVYNDQRRQMMFTLSIESEHPLRYAVPLHKWLPLHAGASGLAILAFLPEETRKEIVHGDLEALTERTIVDPARLEERLAAIREDGYALTHGERIAGAIAVAAPVLGVSGTVLGDLGITIPETRFNASMTSELIHAVKQAAGSFSRRLGGPRAADTLASQD